MSLHSRPKYRIAIFAHSFRSDWNNGNAHFLRGLARAMSGLGHTVVCWETCKSWSETNLIAEGSIGQQSLDLFQRIYGDLDVRCYNGDLLDHKASLAAFDFVLAHEWLDEQDIHALLKLREEYGFKAIFHDTHHRASSVPNAIERLQVRHFDGILAFGSALRDIYLQRFGVDQVWTFHEAADTSWFYPRRKTPDEDVVWIGNWGEGERSDEITSFLLQPVLSIGALKASTYGVRYPSEGLAAVSAAGIAYRGYLPNLLTPDVYASSKVTIHIPRQQYRDAMKGIPTIRVFEALACGIPLVSAPWEDAECLFRSGDYTTVANTKQMIEALRGILDDPQRAREAAQQGRDTILSRHTCKHRAEQLIDIMDELRS